MRLMRPQSFGAEREKEREVMCTSAPRWWPMPSTWVYNHRQSDGLYTVNRAIRMGFRSVKLFTPNGWVAVLMWEWKGCVLQEAELPWPQTSCHWNLFNTWWVGARNLWRIVWLLTSLCDFFYAWDLFAVLLVLLGEEEHPCSPSGPTED